MEIPLSLTVDYPKPYLYRRIVQAKIFIDLHFADPIDLSNVAEEAAFSKFHFLRLFKDIYGFTPYLYLKKVRLEKARDLLSKNIPSNEVCLLVGFESITSFTSLFKRSFGVTPAAYQAERITRLDHIRKTPLRFVPNCFAESNGWTRKEQF